MEENLNGAINKYIDEISDKLFKDTAAVDAKEREGKMTKEAADAERARLLRAAEIGEERFKEVARQSKQVSDIFKHLSGMKEQEAFFECMLNEHRTYQTRLSNVVLWFWRVLAKHGTDQRNEQAVAFAREVMSKFGPDDDKYPHYFCGP